MADWQLSTTLIPWDEFKLQLDPEEVEVWSHLKFMAQSLGEPQKVMFANVPVGVVWPSGAVSLYQPQNRN